MVADEPSAGVEVAAGGLGDHDAHGAGQALDEPGEDERLDGGAGRAQCRGEDVGDDADQEWAAAAEPVGQRSGDDLADGQAEQAGGDGGGASGADGQGSSRTLIARRSSIAR